MLYGRVLAANSVGAVKVFRGTMGLIVSRGCDCMIGQVRTAMMRDQNSYLYSLAVGGGLGYLYFACV